VEDRTRTSQHRRDIYLRPGPGDQKFEGQLPPEIRAELEEGPPPPTYRHRESAPAYLRPAPSSRPETVYTLPPTRPPETEEEIALALECLKSQGYLRSTTPTPPPVPPPLPKTVSNPSLPPLPPWQRVSVPPAARPAPKRSHGAGIIGTLGVILFFWALSHHNAPSSSTAPLESRSVPTPSQSRTEAVRPSFSGWVEVRRALPVAPRALPVTSRESLPPPLPYAQGQLVTMPDGTPVDARYQGELASSAALPPQGRFIGETWRTADGTSWVWMTPAGASFPSWVDP